MHKRVELAKRQKKMYQKTRMSTDSETRSDACSGQQSAVPLAVVEEVLLNLPAHQVVQVCRLVCHEWKELVDSAAHWRVRCRREGLQPNDASRSPEDWCQFYFLSKFRRNLLKNPRADDGLQGWEIVQNRADNWATELNRIPFPDNTVTKCFVTSDSLCLKEQLIDLKEEGYSEAFMDQLRPHIKISDCSLIRRGIPSLAAILMFSVNRGTIIHGVKLPTSLGIMVLGLDLSVSLMEEWNGLEYGLLTVVWKSVQLQFSRVIFFFTFLNVNGTKVTYR
ncbi:F-box only protein 6-like isoform X1 [Carassius auratus]|uniref:F-box only protein 6-like isoform X1 n=1 Tax=Carassius auratus TaxID=7957 RepID=A0A6P6PSC8_CARAU|nr:F-box only protein 6-like isoform X1 [Carassius auratus]